MIFYTYLERLDPKRSVHTTAYLCIIKTSVIITLRLQCVRIRNATIKKQTLIQFDSL